MKHLIVVFAVMAFTFLAANQASAQSKYKIELKINGQWVDVRNSLGDFVMGGRKNQHPIELKLASGNQNNKNYPRTLMGQIKYDQKEGMLGLKLSGGADGVFRAYTKKGNSDWVGDGDWIMLPTIVNLNLQSSDGGKTLAGTLSAKDLAGLHTFEIRAALR